MTYHIRNGCPTLQNSLLELTNCSYPSHLLPTDIWSKENSATSSTYRYLNHNPDVFESLFDHNMSHCHLQKPTVGKSMCSKTKIHGCACEINRSISKLLLDTMILITIDLSHIISLPLVVLPLTFHKRGLERKPQARFNC